MKRRLNIACGLVHRPKVVLLDEPTVGVDPQSRERIYEMLAVLQADGVGVVLTTHHLEEAERRCERVVIIDHGRIVAAGTLGELIEQAIGGPRTIRATLAAPWPAGLPTPEGVTLDAGRRVASTAGGATTDGLVRLVTAIKAAGAEVRDLAIGGGSLQDVFIALTGRELRE
jgi:linearmycin/streptolysin S transport system ATP-binding protein